MKKLFITFIIVFFPLSIFSQRFTEVKGILPALNCSQAQFLDYDCDNDPDIFLWGVFDNNNSAIRDLILYRNNGADQFDSILIEPSIRYGSTQGWIGASDENNDNIPEVVFIGDQYILKFGQYNNGVFNYLSDPALQNISSGGSGVSIADFDNDGSEELLKGLSIYDTYKNIYGTITFTGVYSERTRWIDINNDGRQDIIRIHREQYVTNSTSSILINTGSGFSQNSFNYTDRPWEWTAADYNNDGYEDLLIFSKNDDQVICVAHLFKNDTKGNLVSVKDIDNGSQGRFADIDNDGDLDIIIYGTSEVWGKFHLAFLLNNGNDEFLKTANDTLTTEEYGELTISDYDNDGDVDVLITSFGFPYKGTVKLYRNMLVEDDPAKANTAPSVPSNIKSAVSFDKVKLSWDASTDRETRSSSLTYNVYIKKSDGTFVTSPNANLETGYKRIWGAGNAGYKNYYEINCLSDGDYTWAVQAVDNSNMGSGFSQSGTFSIRGTLPQVPDNLVASTVSHKVIRLQWHDNSDVEDGYIIEMYYDSIPYYRSPGFYEISRVTANVTSSDIENLKPDTQYRFRVKAFNCSSVSSESAEVLAFTYPVPFTKKLILDKVEGTGIQSGDFDRDGDIDFLMDYIIPTSSVGQCILENHTESDTITRLNISLPAVSYYYTLGTSGFFDYNNDGLLDICVVRPENRYPGFSIYKNNGDKTFSEVFCDTLEITPCYWLASFADYDNDGDNDILITYPNGGSIYENLNNGRFVQSKSAVLSGIIKSKMPWCDYNKDGYLDIIACEPQQDYTSRIVLYKNNGNKTFTKTVFERLAGLNNYADANGDIRWGDYNCDGYPDILVSGGNNASSSSGITKIYRNNGDGNFFDSEISNIYGQTGSVSVEWGDMNNDGFLDILMSGENGVDGLSDKTRIYYYINGGYVRQSEDYFMSATQYGCSTMADYDNDGDMDVVVLGELSYTDPQIALYKNFQPHANKRPGAPVNLRSEQTGDELVLSWDKATDDETPSDGLTYNVYIRGADRNVVDPAALESGKRTVVAAGNAGHNNFYKIKHLKNGSYTWSVQAMDNCYEGSEFAAESSFNYVLSDVTDPLSDNAKIVSAYPNPCSEKITLSISNSESKRFDIIVSDLNGKVMSEISDVHLPYNLNTDGLKPAIYIVTLRDGNSSYSIKIGKR